MAEKKTGKVLQPMAHVVLLFLLYAALGSPTVTVQALRLKLIHRDSIYSPLYPGNLTADEQLQRLYDYSEARAQFYQNGGYDQENIRPRVFTSFFMYTVELSIGVPTPGRAPKTYHLVMDTGSALIWLQCEPCIMCWSQNALPFDPSRHTTTLAPVPCDHPFCDLRRRGWTCVENKCHYTIEYANPATTKGYLATETFWFPSEGVHMEQVHNLVFGCSNLNSGFDNLPNSVNGILGLNMKPLSMAGQLLTRIGGGFSYCLLLFTGQHQPPSVMRFGPDALPHGPNVKTMHFVQVPGADAYYLPLVDISIAGVHIGFEPGAFAAQRNGSFVRGGLVIDSGSSAVMLYTGGQYRPYERVRDAFMRYYRPFNLERSTSHHFELCYKGVGFSAFPTMTFHFENGIHLPVAGVSMVFMGGDQFCVLLRPMPGTSILGANAQHNYRISFHLRSKQLSFQPADCRLDL